MSSIKLAVVGTIAVFSLLVLSMMALASPSASVGSTLCGTCHAVKTEAASLQKSAHDEVPCLTCHQSPGVLGAIESVFDGASNLAVWVNPLSDSSPAKSSVVDVRRCLSCHSGIVESGDIVDSELVVDHRHFENLHIGCITCHRGVAHGDKLERGGGMTKSLCIDCHDGLRASEDCNSCHKTDVEGVVPSNPETALGLAHQGGPSANHALADLKTCNLCHEPAECKVCHGVGVPHGSNFIYMHGRYATGRLTDEIEQSPAARAAEARRVFESKCTLCHGLDRPSTATYVASQWADLVERMIKKGAPLNSIESSLVTDYLMTTQGGRYPDRADQGLDSDLAGVDAVTVPPAAGGITSEEFCVTCHNRSYCTDCHGNVEMPHKSQWLSAHQDDTAIESIPLCYRCHVNEECIGCHQAHKTGNLAFPSGPVRYQ